MTSDFASAKQLIDQSSNIVFTTHERTDGDDLGSVLALSRILASQGKNVTLVITGGVPSRLNFMPGSDEVIEELPQSDYDLLIISGCSSFDRVNHEGIMSLHIPVINFDHHPDNTNYGTVNVVDAKKSSVAELMYDFIVWCNWEISASMATSLLTGIITDTGLLMHNNTAASTLATAGKLMQKGALISEVAKHTFTAQGPMEMRAWGKVLENSYYNPSNQMIYAVITQEQIKKLGNPELSSFEGLVETLNKVPEAKFAMFLKEDESGKIKGSLRSEEYKGTDVQKIAQQLGGGGHKLAAGFSMLGKLSKDKEGYWQIVKS